MARHKLFPLAVFLWIGLLPLMGCGGASTPKPPALSGRLIYKDERNVYELPLSNASQAPAAKMIIKDANAVTLSPDKSYILYNAFLENKVKLYDLRKRETLTIVPDNHNSACLSWAPTSANFTTVIDGVILNFDLAGHSTRIYQGKSALYRDPKQSNVPAWREYEVRGCGDWISPDLLLFQRVALFPEKFSDVREDTTTLVTLNDNQPTVRDTAQRWYVIDGCQRGPFTMVRNERGDIFLGKPSLTFGDADLRNMEINDGTGLISKEHRPQRIGFIPGSDCQIYHVSANHVQYIDPNSFHKTLGATLLARKMGLVDDTGVFDGVWIGDIKDNQLIVSHLIGYEHTVTISIANGADGSERDVISFKSETINMVGWLSE
ncbi:MAG: hypothetical protein HZB53_05780 [Chloroflexi bacterium]|nr:hypothetical protein [Chloroflexota bacterium]